jgi:hypothetical protein
MLVQAASGLEKYMAGSKPGVLKDSTVAQISAFVYYQSHVIAKLSKNKGFINRFHDVIFDSIDKEFGQYMDAQARIKPKSLHHVYEWNKMGNAGSRLFKLKMLPSTDLSFKISYGLLEHVFREKASIMEAGMPLKIAPRHSERLVFETNGYTVFMPKGASVTVLRPGGVSVKDEFKTQYGIFFKGQLVNQAIKKSGFQNIFNQSIAKALRVPVSIKKVRYSFSPNTIRTEADNALTASFGGSMI